MKNIDLNPNNSKSLLSENDLKALTHRGISRSKPIISLLSAHSANYVSHEKTLARYCSNVHPYQVWSRSEKNCSSESTSVHGWSARWNQYSASIRITALYDESPKLTWPGGFPHGISSHLFCIMERSYGIYEKVRVTCDVQTNTLRHVWFDVSLRSIQTRRRV